MRPATFVFIVLSSAVLSAPVDGRRVKRRLDEFGEMILLKCKRNPLDFNGYGSFCGFGGRGVPVDAIDRCCRTHDSCYTKLNRAECDTLLKYKVYTTQYRWSFKNGNIICNEEDTCAHELCECDRVAATCFGNTEHVYDKRYKHRSLVSGISKLIGMDFTRDHN